MNRLNMTRTEFCVRCVRWRIKTLLFLLFVINVALFYIHSTVRQNTPQLRTTERSRPFPSEEKSESGCSSLRLRNVWVSPEEHQFPIAYAISAHESYSRLSRLLRLIYRPHNVYCIHLDAKASAAMAQNVSNLRKCFGSNLILVPDDKRVAVWWGYFSVLESVLLCADLLRKHRDVHWRYLLNVNEKEFPLRTNWEIVKALRALNGSNMIEGYHYESIAERIPRKKPSFNMTWIKGSLLMAARREFIDYALTDKHALELLSLMRAERGERRVQDELFFSTLAYNPELGAPGACLHVHHPNQSDQRSLFLARYVNWDIAQCPKKKIIHEVCILGRRDVEILKKRPELFANKFVPNIEPEAYDLMELWFESRLAMEKERHDTDPQFDTALFSDLYCSREHI